MAQKHVDWKHSFVYLLSILSENIKDRVARNTERDKDDKFVFIPNYQTDMLAEIFSHLRNECFYQKDPTFLDVGCGIGNIALLAQAFGFSAFGLEYRKEYGSAIVMRKDNFIVGDGLQFKRYDEYDVLYFYRPFKCSQKQLLLEEKIINGMKKGAFLINCGGEFHSRYQDERASRRKKLADQMKLIPIKNWNIVYQKI